MTADHAGELRQALLEVVKTHDVQLGRLDGYGQRYRLDFVLEWQNKSTLLRSGWMIERESEIPRLTTCYPLWSPEAIDMVEHSIELLDIVALTVNLPEYNLSRGQVGTVVERLANGGAFEVEFSDRDGRTYESLGLRPDRIMVLHFEPALPQEESLMVAK